MARKEEIMNAIDAIIPIPPPNNGRTYEQALMATGFEAGAKWADEHINLESLWHDASEEPNDYPILCIDKLSNILIEYSLKNYDEGWAECVEFNDISQWAYIKDLLPKN